MSRLLVVARPGLVSGFRLAGVEAYAAASAEAAQKLVTGWLEAGESGLLVMDEGLLAALPAAFRRRLEGAARLPCLALPVGITAGREAEARRQMAELIRRTVGFHITFHGEEA